MDKLAIPDCPDCHGTGKIELLTSTVSCKCIQDIIDKPTIKLIPYTPTIIGKPFYTQEMLDDIQNWD